MQLEKSKWIESIFDTMGALILGYIKTIVRDEHFAEDVMQNTFIKLWKVDPQKIDNPKSYVFAIARNESLTRIGKKQKEQLNYVSQAFNVLETTDSKKVSTIETLCIEEALLKLPIEQREIIYLKIYAEFTFQKIADTLQISINTVGSRYRYAMEKLNELLGDANGE